MMRSSVHVHVRWALGICCAASSALALPGNSWAQQAGAESPSASPALILEDIVVTARRREENIQETPVSIAAFTADALETRGVTDLQGLDGFVPNVVIATAGSFGSTGASFAIRGSAQDRNSVTLEPGVGLYVDGIYMGRAESGLLRFSDIQRIEVLRGPQGTLFGKNTSGGAIQVITAKPGDEFAAQVRASGGSFDRRNVEGKINMPFGETLAMKLSAFSDKQDGYVKRPDGVDVDDDDTTGARAQLSWRPSTQFTVDLSADYEDVDRNGVGLLALAINPNAPFPTLAAADGAANPPYDSRWVPSDPSRQTNATGPTYHKQHAWGTSAEINWDLDSFAIKSLSSYRTYGLNFSVDGDGTPVRMFETTVTRDFEQYSQEFQLSGKGFSDRLNWVTGLFYFREDPSEVRAINQRGSGPRGNTERFSYDQQTKSYAAFGQATYAITDALSATLGGRFSRDEKELVLTEPSRFTGVSLTGKNNSDAFTPRVDLQYKLMPQLMAYISYARGFKGGGINDRIISVPGGGFTTLPFDDEKSKTYEAGIRSDWFERRLRLNGTYFHTEYQDLQQPLVTLDPVIPNRTLVLTQNIGEAKVDGVEAELDALLTANWTVNGSLGYQDSRITELRTPSTSFRVGGELGMTPRRSASVGTEYTIPFAGGSDLRLRTDYNWTDKRLTTTSIDNGVVDPSHGVLGASVAYTSSTGLYRLTAYGTNLTDKFYYSNATNFFIPFGVIQAEPARPREYGLQVEFNFGASQK